MLCDFECKECKFVFEDLIGSSDPNPVCARCKSKTDRLLPLISPTLKLAIAAVNEALAGNNCTKKYIEK